MKQLLYSLGLLLSVLTAQAQTPTVTMTTTAVVGSDLYFYIAANTDNKTIAVDWGNGTQSSYTVNITQAMVYGSTAGSTIKIYGEGITYLYVSSSSLTTMDVTAATSLEKLFVDNNQLTTINLSNNIALKELYCQDNNIESLSLANNTALKKVWCYKNKLTSLDLSSNTALYDFDCSYNQLTTLNLASNTSLFTLTCSDNLLSSITLPTSNALSEVRCKNNHLSNLNVANVPSIYILECSNNQITSLNLSNNTNLQYLFCNKNLLSALDLTNKPSLYNINCAENNFTFTSLPSKQAGWSVYTYSPQPSFPLPKKSYAIAEVIDLSSQLTANSVTTTYIWKTKGGQLLTGGVDYTENSGVFTILSGQSDSLICEMTNTTLPDLTLSTTAIAVPMPAPSVIMTTTTAVGSTFSFEIAANAENTTIKVDWGNGVLSNYTVGTSNSTISGTLMGNTIKIFGADIIYLNIANKNLTSLDISGAAILYNLNCSNNSITTLDLNNNLLLKWLLCYENSLSTLDVTKNVDLQYLYCDRNHLATLDLSKNAILNTLYCYGNQLANLDVSNNIALESLMCHSNQLTFSTLPIKQPAWTTFTYSPQSALKLPKRNYITGEAIDLSSQHTINGNTTAYVWKTKSGTTLVKGVDYSEDNGKFTFIKEQGDYLFCQMTNASFPVLTLTTETICIPSTSPAVTMTTTTAVGTTFSFYIAATTENATIQVDWGDGVLTDYSIGTWFSSVTGILTGSNIKVYGVGITYFDLQSKNLTALDLSGATVLTRLYCNINQLTTLDVSKNLALTHLYCPNNVFNNGLDVSKNTALTYLCCAVNQLTNLDVSKNTALIYLDCSYNKLTTIDVSKNTALTGFDCCFNQLTNLDILKNPALTSLFCGGNKLTVLDVSKNTALTSLYCYSNQLTSLDVSKNIALTSLGCRLNQLTNLDLSKNTALTYLTCYSNQLTFSTLPIKQPAWTTFTYSPQSALKLPKKNYITGEAIDLSSQLAVNGNTSAYVWKTKGGTTLTSGVDYTANNGVFTFSKTESDSVYCAMTNASFPGLTLNTTNVKITQFPTSVEETEVKVTVFPNPVSDNLSIESDENIVRVEVFTVTGMKVYATDGNNTNTMTLSVASCPKGLLIVKVYGRDGVMERKVIKN